MALRYLLTVAIAWLVLADTALGADAPFDWDENGGDWAELDIPGNECGNTLRQSPIDIRRGGHSFLGGHTLPDPLNIKPNEVVPGQSAVSFLYPKLTTNMTIMWGPEANPIFVEVELRDTERKADLGYLRYLTKTFTAVSFHFHARSEHTFDGKQLPLEMHIVHVRTDTDGAMQPEFAVLGYVFDVGFKENEFLASLENPAQDGPRIPSIENPEVVYEVDSDLSDLAAFASTSSIYHYAGSLTTPPCTQAVNWFVVEKPQLATRRQLEMWIRAHYNGTNYRLTQNPEVYEGEAERKNRLTDEYKVLKIKGEVVASLLPVDLTHEMPVGGELPSNMKTVFMLKEEAEEEQEQDTTSGREPPRMPVGRQERHDKPPAFREEEREAKEEQEQDTTSGGRDTDTDEGDLEVFLHAWKKNLERAEGD
ncbi:unnamed protein product [Vitrella brassicaformis CCMP3155]|uniref:carbonic anhydrase n=1 Tax=Vitrella brassicaformis (strain CCMP3155) TaxID=1169540 RepID=A0A0G4ECA8_VITBC|nr:unnamed protein product [Vitrella brassicaformis CCMP3155]|eukprot:CEL93341.1 unnamed protein product [Vitrella brassicaformis CCMP3155]